MKRNPRIVLRSARPSHARTIHALIEACREEGHLLPRSLEEIERHADRFVIAVRGRKVVACAELAPLSPRVAEVRSLVVSPEARGTGAGTSLVDELRRRARKAGFDRLCAFTHCPGYFSQLGFSMVPHLWIPEKIFTDCVNCPSFRTCGQQAMVASLHDVCEKAAERAVFYADAASATSV